MTVFQQPVKPWPTVWDINAIKRKRKEFRIMNTHPANWREYWDRLIKLNRETSGNFTIEQLWETLGTTPMEIASIEESIGMIFDDDIDHYEAASDVIKAWEGELIAEIYIENGTNRSPAYRPPPTDSQRLQELRGLMSVASKDRARLKIEDRATNRASEVKYITLLRASRGAERIERDSSQTYRPELYVKNDEQKTEGPELWTTV
jgi:hypothetical protein